MAVAVNSQLNPLENAERQFSEAAAWLKLDAGMMELLKRPRRATIQWLPEQPGDVPQTWASIDKARRLFGYQPATPFADGVRRFTSWMAAAAVEHAGSGAAPRSGAAVGH